MEAIILLLLALISLTCSIIAFATSDQIPIQDFCVADVKYSETVYGYACKDPKLVIADDFYLSGTELAGNTSNPFGSSAKRISLTQLPGLNTLGITIARADFAPWGVNPPHYHPRASEIITVVEGTIEAGFITSNPENRLLKKILVKGDVFVNPRGLVHYQRNVGDGNAAFIAALASQNPGVVMVGNAVFGSDPTISSDLLAKAFQVDENVIHKLQEAN
ncbi:hypothetical protein ACOSQ3_011658 [Xanthoceras sorbifolium]